MLPSRKSSRPHPFPEIQLPVCITLLEERKSQEE
jgi:hypothetical protein